MEQNDGQINVRPVTQKRHSKMFRLKDPVPPATVIFGLWLGKSGRGVCVCVSGGLVRVLQLTITD